jgi:hypothetical protein
LKFGIRDVNVTSKLLFLFFSKILVDHIVYEVTEFYQCSGSDFNVAKQQRRGRRESTRFYEDRNGGIQLPCDTFHMEINFLFFKESKVR